jgi:hypothetical protein
MPKTGGNPEMGVRDGVVMARVKKITEVEAGDEIVVGLEPGQVVTAISCPAGDPYVVRVLTDRGSLIAGWHAEVTVTEQ